tara:strand:+ start:461 stop:1828 length:1368 start_codon:yes stop_codon:yes gene_type:complete
MNLPLRDKVDTKIFSKYGSNAFMYTEYPHKKFWNNKLSYPELIEALKKGILENKDENFLLYIHIPHCHTQCLYCTCHVEITKDYNQVKRYMDYLFKEFDLLTDLFDSIDLYPKISDVHLGGGSPTYPRIEDFDLMVEKINKITNVNKLNEFSIEIDPRRVKEDKMLYYHSKGINRISFGVQEFDLEVQKHIARVQPRKLTERLLTPKIRKLFPNGINFDLLCGLPGQNLNNFKNTINTTIDLNPDRICLNYMHLAPKFHKHQLLMPNELIPDQLLKKELFTLATELLEKNGYIRAAYDHFVKKDDYLSSENEKQTMSWNRLGVVSGNYTNIIGVGVNSTCKLSNNIHYQNYFENEDYEKNIDMGKLPIVTHHVISNEDYMREELIQTIRNYFRLDKNDFSKKYNINFNQYFEKNIEKLGEYKKNGLLTNNDNFIELTPVGYQFSNLIASSFDEYL